MTSSCSKHAPPGLLVRTWLALVALSLATAALTLLHLPAKLLGGAILCLALAKAHLILARFLELDSSPTWLRGFTLVLILFAILIYALFLI